MTAEHLSQIQLLGYQARSLDAEELLAVDRHLASCDECQGGLANMAPARSHDLSIKEEPFHLDYDQHVEPYVDGVADEIDREIVESHMALCSQCAEEIRDLQEFRKQPARQVDRAVEMPRRTPWMDQWPWLRQLNPRLAAALAVALLIPGITIMWLWTRSRTTQPEYQVGPVALPGNEPSPGPTYDGIPSPSPDQSTKLPVVALTDGGRQITLDEDGHSKGLESLPVDLRNTIEKVLASRKFGLPPVLFGLSESAGRLRGDVETEDAIGQLAPVGVVVETDRPVFRWNALEGATEYIVTVHDSKLRLVESSGPVAGTEWSIPKALERGRLYSWQVRAVVDGKTVISPKPPAPDTLFKVLDRKALQAIENAKRAQGNSHLTMAVLYWKHGLIEAAEREAQALVRANPGSAVAADLLRSLQSLRRR
jgi:hypothetical protein